MDLPSIPTCSNQYRLCLKPLSIIYALITLINMTACRIRILYIIYSHFNLFLLVQGHVNKTANFHSIIILLSLGNTVVKVSKYTKRNKSQHKFQYKTYISGICALTQYVETVTNYIVTRDNIPSSFFFQLLYSWAES